MTGTSGEKIRIRRCFQIYRRTRIKLIKKIQKKKNSTVITQGFIFPGGGEGKNLENSYLLLMIMMMIIIIIFIRRKFNNNKMEEKKEGRKKRE